MKRFSKKLWIICAAVLLAAAAGAAYLALPLRGERKEETAYTPMEDADLPVAYMEMCGRQMNPLYGFREDDRDCAGRGNLTVLPQDRRLTVDFYNLDSRITGVQYEIRSLEDERLIERTVVQNWHQDEGSQEAVTILPIQNLIDKDKEYILTLAIATENQPAIYYYTRIVWTDNTFLGDMLSLAETFSDNTFHYENASDLTTYLETDAAADNSSLGNVTLKNSFDQITWGSLEMEKAGNVEVELKEMQGIMASVRLSYLAARMENGEAAEYYDVCEDFTMKWNAQRIYMMDYNRTVNQVFDGDPALYSGKRIMLGISDGTGLQEITSPNGRFHGFVTNGELWLYDGESQVNTRVFSFRQSETDPLIDVTGYGLKILSVSDEGEVDFLVNGYMSRGSHEGSVGVALWRYRMEGNSLTERLYLPADEGSEELQLGIDRLSYLGENGILYLMMGNSVYSVNMETRESRILAEGLTEENFAVGAGQSRIAWQDGTDAYDASTVHVMDLKTGRSDQIHAPEGKNIRILGFVGSDLVYGLAEENTGAVINGRTAQVPMYALEIAGEDMQIQTRYEKEGIYITDVEIRDSRVHLEKLSRAGDSYTSAGNDTLVCNEEMEEDTLAGIGYLASEEKGRVYFVQLDESVSGSEIRLKVPEKVMAEENNTVSVTESTPLEKKQYYAYSEGRLRGRFVHFADAVTAAYDDMGIVTDEAGRVFWARADRPDIRTIRDPQSLVTDIERYLREFADGELETSDGGAIIDAGGLSLNQVLYFVGRGYPVAAYTGDGSYMLIYGYDPYNISCLWNPGTENANTDKMGLNDGADWFDSNGGNDFVAFLTDL